MKNSIRLSLLVLLLIAACKEAKTTENTTTSVVRYESFGAEINEKDALDEKAMYGKYSNLKMGDTIQVKFASKINEVCSKKGCWMKLSLPDGSETMVTFKDYEFFMPLDSQDSEVIVNGKAFVSEISVADLRHFAEDAGKSKEEIAKITEPKVTFAFEADGVLMKK
ncbi:DUF4920 domain-containing protein [Polaribacter pacificus]|nr:DUF4920 domain-containing protein [Polaribacter pacificus]